MKSQRDDSSTSDENPNVPGFQSWRGVYLFVFIVFILVVVFLTLFSRAFE